MNDVTLAKIESQEKEIQGFIFDGGKGYQFDVLI